MRTVFTGGRVFDGTGAPVAEADVAIEDGLIAEVGVGLDGDEQVDVTGSTLLPGLFDTHVHVMYGAPRHVEAPADAVLVHVLRRDQEPRRDASARDHDGARRGRRRPRREAGGRGGNRPRPAPADLAHDAEPDRRARRRLDAVGWQAISSRLPGHAVARSSTASRRRGEDPRARPERRRRDQDRDLGRSPLADATRPTSPASRSTRSR